MTRRNRPWVSPWVVDAWSNPPRRVRRPESKPFEDERWDAKTPVCFFTPEGEAKLCALLGMEPPPPGIQHPLWRRMWLEDP